MVHQIGSFLLGTSIAPVPVIPVSSSSSDRRPISPVPGVSCARFQPIQEAIAAWPGFLASSGLARAATASPGAFANPRVFVRWNRATGGSQPDFLRHGCQVQRWIAWHLGVAQVERRSHQEQRLKARANPSVWVFKHPMVGVRVIAPRSDSGRYPGPGTSPESG
jgi:hypothetical protein